MTALISQGRAQVKSQLVWIGCHSQLVLIVCALFAHACAYSQGLFANVEISLNRCKKSLADFWKYCVFFEACALIFPHERRCVRCTTTKLSSPTQLFPSGTLCRILGNLRKGQKTCHTELLRVVRAGFAFSICTNFYLYYLKCFCFLLRHFFMYVTVASLISDYVIYMDVSFQCLVVLVYLLTRGSKQDMIQKLNTINKSHTTKIGMSLVQTNIFNHDKREVRKKWNICTISLVMHSKDIMLL